MQVHTVCIQKGVSRQHGVGGDNGGGAAYTAGYLDALIRDLGLVTALVGLTLVCIARGNLLGGGLFRIGMAVTVDLALGVQIVNDEEDDV